MKKRIAIKDLQLGMFVSELDRPWLESPFLFQGFLIETQEELGMLQEHCDHVFVDVSQSLSERQLHEKQAPGGVADPIDPKRLAVDYENVSRASAPVRMGMIKSIEDRRLGHMVRTEPLKESVTSLLDTVLTNPNAALWLTRVREADEFTATHSINVAVLSVAFANHLGVDSSQLEGIGLGAILHDIGLSEISSSIIRKKSALADEEFALVRQHPTEALACIENAESLPQASRDVIRWHHERIDGSGYPDGLAGDDIPHHVRIVALADAYDAMASDRIYRKGMQPSEALQELYREGSETYGKDLVRTFISCIGIYPAGTLVQLNTGAVGMVVASREESRLLPLVLLLLDPEGQRLHPRQMIDLARLEEKTGKRWSIERTVEPDDYGLDIEAIMEEEQRLTD